MSLHSRAGLTLATCIALHAGAIAAEQLHVPTCDAFVEYGRRAVGIDEIHAAQILGFPLRDLSDHDIDLIGDALSKCSSQATSREQRSLLAEARKQLPHFARHATECDALTPISPLASKMRGRSWSR